MLRVSALDCGEEAAHWMSTFLKRNCRLIEHHKQDNRTCKLGGIVYKNPFFGLIYTSTWIKSHLQCNDNIKIALGH